MICISENVTLTELPGLTASLRALLDTIEATSLIAFLAI